ncbi:PREDICTED: fibroblast growth factor-binding protein 3 [Gekko japonicus]|uniref:Fibroblast growth factor-binding protein 3 n=1 Tax=Gekko japonicus TaxID=146911 RepID=A0ABM1JKY9_GEKJA|nr:PREDICTED: fibroblast growth factor-binding protein 3 [Gekko japonicus]
MRLPQTLPLTLLFLGCLDGAPPGKKGKENSEKAKPSSPWAQTGQFSTRDKELCSWQLIPGEEVTEIHLSCQQLGEDSGTGQQCVYRGQPELCPAYSSKGRQFWKQILGKLRRKHHPCQDSSPLKSRLCSGKKGASEAELHLVPPALTTAAPVAESSAKGKSKGKARAKDLQTPQKPPQAPRARGVTSSAKADAPDKRSKGGKKKVTPSSSVAPTHPSSSKLPAVLESTELPTELNAEVAAAYCEEKWHSLCNFFVNFWNG